MVILYYKLFIYLFLIFTYSYCNLQQCAMKYIARIINLTINESGKAGNMKANSSINLNIIS